MEISRKRLKSVLKTIGIYIPKHGELTLKIQDDRITDIIIVERLDRKQLTD